MRLSRSLQTNNPYGAIFIALAIPDICGWASNPTQKSGARYAAFFTKYLSSHYITAATAHNPEYISLTGDDLYALRCAYLHQGMDDTTDQKASDVVEKFVLVTCPPQLQIHNNSAVINGKAKLQLQVDVLCQQMMDAAKAFLADNNVDAAVMNRIAKMSTIQDAAAGLQF